MKLSYRAPWIGGLGVLMAVIYLIKGSGSLPAGEPLAMPANVPYKSYIGGSGVLEPNSGLIALGASTAGIVTQVPVKAGEAVVKNQVLMVVDPREAQARLKEAQAKLLQVQTQFKQHQEIWEMVGKLSNPSSISTLERVQKKQAFLQSAAQVRVAQAELEAAQVALDLCTLRAPIDGVIMSSNVRVGEFMSTGVRNPPTFRMGSLNPLNIRVDIDENDAWRFKPGARAVAFLRGNPNIQVELKFIRVEPYVRPKVNLTGEATERVDARVLQLMYQLKNNAHTLYSGQQMDVYIEEQPQNESKS